MRIYKNSIKYMWNYIWEWLMGMEDIWIFVIKGQGS
jgi:hypothetical protein